MLIFGCMPAVEEILGSRLGRSQHSCQKCWFVCTPEGGMILWMQWLMRLADLTVERIDLPELFKKSRECNALQVCVRLPSLVSKLLAKTQNAMFCFKKDQIQGTYPPPPPPQPSSPSLEVLDSAVSQHFRHQKLWIFPGQIDHFAIANILFKLKR